MTDKEPRVAIVIPARDINDYLKEALIQISKLDYGNFEVFVFPDQVSLPPDIQDERIKIIPTGQIKPGQKRNLALKHSSAEILAFLDDDAYPRQDWLERAIPYFQDDKIAAVCGPGVTPSNDSLRQRASGWVSASFLGGGPIASHRFLAKGEKEVDDYPSMNLIVRRNDFEMMGGFDSNFWPGEDSHLCLNLTKKLGKKIIYNPEVIVYHHRRALFSPHLKQNGRYGLHRGYFARILPETSRRLSYFVPSLFFLFFFLTPLAILIFKGQSFSFWLGSLYLILNTLYLILLLATAVWVYFQERNFKIAFLVIPGIFLTHLWYGFCFLQGFLSKELKT